MTFPRIVVLLVYKVWSASGYHSMNEKQIFGPKMCLPIWKIEGSLESTLIPTLTYAYMHYYYAIMKALLN